jgi:glycosyltransferase involved in cell wall biosynthesis
VPTPLADPRVSVALCTRNGAYFVRAQVASILRQSHPVDELVISDDASSDDTIEIIRSEVADHAKAGGREIALTVLRNKVPLGVTRNFEQAVLATTGELIALCDQDDLWRSDRVETIVAAFTDPAVQLVFSDARLVDGDGAPLGDSLFATLSMTSRERRQLRSGSAFDALLGRNLVTGATVVFRRELLGLAVPFGSSWVHDEWLAALAAAEGGVRMLEAELIDYRQHGRNEIGAGRLNLSQKVGRVTEPRAARNARLLARAQELADRLDRLGERIPERVRVAARSKVAHEQWRSALPAARIRRLPAITGELARGGYAHYGRGILDAGRDLVQPVG